MNWQIIPTGRVWVDPGGPFGLVPISLWEKHHLPPENGLIPMDMNCLLVHSDGKVILVDTGLGDKLDQKAAKNWGIEYPHGTLIENLAELGITSGEVDLVINTHLHSDHCGGNTTIAEGELVPAFPNAIYIVQWLEWADAMHPNVRTRNTYLHENFRPVWEKGLYRFLHGDAVITEDVRCVVTRGHTRGHQCVIVESDETPLLFVADLASFAVNMARAAWLTAYDVEPLENIATKQRWQAWALERNALLAFEHDTRVPLGQLKKNTEGKIQISAIEHPSLAQLS